MYLKSMQIMLVYAFWSLYVAWISCIEMLIVRLFMIEYNCAPEGPFS